MRFDGGGAVTTDGSGNQDMDKVIVKAMSEPISQPSNVQGLFREAGFMKHRIHLLSKTWSMRFNRYQVILRDIVAEVNN